MTIHFGGAEKRSLKMRDLIVATSAMRAIERGVREISAAPREPYACLSALVYSLPGNGMSTGFHESATVVDAPLLECRPAASLSDFWAIFTNRFAVVSATFGGPVPISLSAIFAQN